MNEKTLAYVKHVLSDLTLTAEDIRFMLKGIFSLVLVLTLVGCGKNSTSTVPKPEEKTVSTTKEKIEYVPQVTKKVTTTTYGPDGKPVAPPKAPETPK